MPAKRFVLIILCILLAVMLVLFAVVGSRFAPILGILANLGGNDSTTGPTTTAPNQTTAPTQGTTVPPTSEPTVPPTVPPTEPPTEPTDPPHVHEYTVSKVVPAECGTTGYTVYTCACGKTDIRDIVEGPDHAYGEGIKVAPTCEAQGYTEHICVNCGHSDKRNYIDALKHDYQLVETQEPSCEQDGYELYRCTRCDGEKLENEVPAPGHTCEGWVETLPPAPGQQGEESAVCTVCGETVTRPCELHIRYRYQAYPTDYNSYTLYVGSETSPKAIEYIINDYSKGDITFAYTESGLQVILNGEELTTLEALQNITLTIDAEGNIAGGELPPSPSDPSEPSEPTDPSNPSDPSIPPENEE